ncbi:hypothetical protein ACQ858_08315 [Variovorax ureilyticus]|uniref:hypothetical protein n=1 Tax=Variovorax ureilyticus TaxID=1836198 RepID=UPI003D67CC80
MSRGYDLYKRHTVGELIAKQQAVRADPASKNTRPGIHIYTPKARRLLDDLAWAVRYHTEHSA